MFVIRYSMIDQFGEWEGSTARDDVFSVMDGLIDLGFTIDSVETKEVWH